MIKWFGLMKRKPDMTSEEFSRYWRDVHGPLAAKLMPGVVRYTQTCGIKLANGEEAQFDGLSEAWFEDWDSLRRMADFLSQSENGKLLINDMGNFLDLSKS